MASRMSGMQVCIGRSLLTVSRSMTRRLMAQTLRPPGGTFRPDMLPADPGEAQAQPTEAPQAAAVTSLESEMRAISAMRAEGEIGLPATPSIPAARYSCR